MQTSICQPLAVRRLLVHCILTTLCLLVGSQLATAATISWTGAGGDDLWSNPSNWAGGALPTSDDDVVINVPGSVTVRIDTSATVRSLQCQESIWLEAGPLTLTNGTSFVNGAFNMGPVQALSVIGPATTFTAHGVVTNLAGLFASGGGVISFPNTRQVEAVVWSFSTTAGTGWSASGSGSVIEMANLTNLVALGSTYRGVDLLKAMDGGRIDLRQLRSTEGDIGASAANSESVIDLSGLEGLWTVGPADFGLKSRMTASDSGTIHIPQVTALDRVDLTLSDSGQIETAQLRSITGSTITLTSRTNGFSALTNFSGQSSICVVNSRLDLPQFKSLGGGNTCLHIQAGQDSHIDLSELTNFTGTCLGISANSGSSVDVSRLKNTQGYPVSATASGEGSWVNLSGYGGLWEGGAISASMGGTIMMPNVMGLHSVNVSVSDTASVNLQQLSSFTATPGSGTITLSNRTNDLRGLTHFSGFLQAYNSRLGLTNLTTIYATNPASVWFHADAGSIIDLSHVTNATVGWPAELRIIADNGGQIDLSRLPVPENGPIAVDARGAGSFIDLSGFSGRWDGSGSVTARDGATVDISNVTAMRGVSLDLRDEAVVPTAQLRDYTLGTIQLVSRTNVFLSLTNFSGTLDCIDSRAEFPGLTRLDISDASVSFRAWTDSVIDLTQVTGSVVSSSGNALTLWAYYGGRIHIPGLETISVNNVSLLSEGPESILDVSGLTGFFSDDNSNHLTARNGGTLLLNTNALLLAGVEINIQDDPDGVLPSFAAASPSVVLYGRPWQAYRVESLDLAVPGSPWMLYARVPLTSPLQELGPRPPMNTLLRVSTFTAHPPELDIRRAPSDSVEVVLFGQPAQTYGLESRLAFGTGTWEPGPTITTTNSFHIFSSTAATNTTRFYRARVL